MSSSTDLKNPANRAMYPFFSVADEGLTPEVSSTFRLVESVAVFGTALAWVWLLLLDDVDPGYDLIWVLPATFLACYFIHLRESLRRSLKVFRLVFVGVAFLRYVLSPVLIRSLGQYGTWSTALVDTAHVRQAVMLMSVELIACTLALRVLDRRRVRRQNGLRFRPGAADLSSLRFNPGPYWRYWGIIAVGGLIILAGGPARSFLTFIPFGDGTFSVDLADTNVAAEVAIIVVIVSKHALFLASMLWAHRRFVESRISLYGVFAAFITVANSVVFYGSNRLTAIYIAVASFVLYAYLFPRFRAWLLLPFMFILGQLYRYMTDARNYWDPFSAYNGIEKAFRALESGINAYLGGVHNVAIAVRMSESGDGLGLPTSVVYDIIRPFIGLNLLVRDSKTQLSNHRFNEEFYGSGQVDQILPAIGQGNFFFGWFFAWLIPAGLVCLAVVLERLIISLRRVEFYYLGTIALMRLGMLAGTNASIQMNELSLQFVPAFLVLYALGFSFMRKSGRCAIRAVNRPGDKAYAE